MDYFQNKAKMSYELTQNNKFFKKARALVIKNKKLLVIKVEYSDGRETNYLLPGGGVDEGETAKQTAVRETLEEYNAVVKATKYMGRQYYNVPMEYDGKKFVSHRVEYYYLCEFVKDGDYKQFGVDGEFNNKEKKYTKMQLSISEIKKIGAKKLNFMAENVYNKLIEVMKGL